MLSCDCTKHDLSTCDTTQRLNAWMLSNFLYSLHQYKSSKKIFAGKMLVLIYRACLIVKYELSKKKIRASSFFLMLYMVLDGVFLFFF